MRDTYHTIPGPSEGLYKEKGSKFFAYAYPVQESGEAEAHINDLKKQYHDARHVAFAWRLGRDGGETRTYDAGEPAHSAGDPILNEIRSKELTYIVVVVIRYFGGTKLGLSGLTTAYGLAAKAALENAKIVRKTITKALQIRYPYSMTSEVNRLMHKHQLKPAASEFMADCQQTLDIPESEYEKIEQVFVDLGIVEKAR